MNRHSGLALLAVALFAGCAAGGEPTVSPSTTAQASETIQATPTPTPTPSQEPITVRVTFDGTKCVYEGPRVFLDGTEVLFTFVPTDEWAQHAALIVGDVTPGTTLEEVRADLSSRAAHERPPYLIEYWDSYGPGTFRATMSTMVSGVRPTGGYVVVCVTSPETTDDAFFADLLTIAGG